MGDIETGVVTLKVNGKEITVRDGTLILDAAREAGYHIPTFCYQATLSGVGSCRMCLVEIEGQRKLQPSCVTPVMSGMEVKTESESVISARQAMLEFLLSNHALDCPVCDKGGECELQNMVYTYGPRKGRYAEVKIRHHEKDYVLSPVIVKNSNRCVQCMRCVRVCGEVVGRGVLGAIGRGAHQEETSFLRSYLDCDHDGMCIEVCPVGCFMRRPYRYRARPWDLRGSRTVCPYCATGCRMTIEERDGEVVRSIAREGEGFNDKMLCARGRFGYDILNSGGEERLTTPLIKKNGMFEPVSWEKALSIIREQFTKADPRRLGGIASAALTNEELYLFQRLVREVLGSGNIDSTSRWEAATTGAFIFATGITGGGVSIYDCMEADTVFVVGGQVSEENPVTDYIIRYVSGSSRKSVLVASTRAMKLDTSAELSLRHLPGRLGALFNGLVLTLYEDNRERLEGIKEIGVLKGRTVTDLAAECGVSEADLRALCARLESSGSISMVVGTDLLRFREGISGLRLLGDALRALGKVLKILPVLDRCNQRGAWDMGVHPLFGPDYRKVERAGLGCDGMLDQAMDGAMDALYVVGEDVVNMYPDRTFAEEALSRVGFLVVQDVSLTDTARMAHLVLPGAYPGEKEGTFTNQEGRVQHISRLLEPPGQARVDLEIIEAVGSSIVHGFSDGTPQTVFDEIRRGVSMYRDAAFSGGSPDGWLVKKSARRLEGFELIEEKKVSLDADPEHPYFLVTGNHIFLSGSLSRRSGILNELVREAVVEISEEAAGELGVIDGQTVSVSGRGFDATYSVRIRKGTPREVVFIAENFEDKAANRFYKRGDVVPRVKITA